MFVGHIIDFRVSDSAITDLTNDKPTIKQDSVRPDNNNLVGRESDNREMLKMSE